jgi:phospholipid/cholesterol/gamma-HCH transport system substrate-binding protein
MSDHTPHPAAESSSPVSHLELKAGLLLLAMVALVVASAAYLLYARGTFERTQQLTLVTDDAEGVTVGMDMTFSGFPIGRVRRVGLAENGSVRIVVDVPIGEAHWLRETSVFVLARGLVGDTRLRAYSGVMSDPPLPPDAVRNVLRGDATAEIPKLVAAARELVANLTALTQADSALAQSLANVKAATERLNGPHGALGLAFGNDKDARQLVSTLERANGLLARVDGLVARADAQVFGPAGIMRDAQASVVQLRELLHASRELLQGARESLRRLDAVLDETRAIAGNVRGATTDLDALRADVEASLRRVDQLINEINRKWPFKRDTEIRLP